MLCFYIIIIKPTKNLLEKTCPNLIQVKYPYFQYRYSYCPGIYEFGRLRGRYKNENVDEINFSRIGSKNPFCILIKYLIVLYKLIQESPG